MANLKYKGVDIKGFINLRYDDVASVRMPLLVYEMNAWVLLDYRTKSEIKEGINNAKFFQFIKS